MAAPRTSRSRPFSLTGPFPLSAAFGRFLFGDERRVDLKPVEGPVKVLDVGGKGVEGIDVSVENAGHPQGAQDAGGNGGVPLLDAAGHLIDRAGLDSGDRGQLGIVQDVLGGIVRAGGMRKTWGAMARMDS